MIRTIRGELRARSAPLKLAGAPSAAFLSGHRWWEAAVRVLVVEDDRELAEAIGVGLRREQMAVDLAFDGDAGLEHALVTSYDVIVLDRDLPVMTGDEICAN